MPRAMLPLEKMSDPMQGLYADLRHQYPRASIDLTPEEGVMLLTFTDGPTVRINETPTGRFRVRATRRVPAGRRTKDVEQAKTAQDARAVLYAIDGFLVEPPKVAALVETTTAQILRDTHTSLVATSNQGATFETTLYDTVRQFRTLVASLLRADAPPAYEQIAHMFLDGLGPHPEQLSSQQLGDQLARFITTDLPTKWDAASVTPEMWQDIGLLLEQHGLHMDDRDFNAAIDKMS